MTLYVQVDISGWRVNASGRKDANSWRLFALDRSGSGRAYWGQLADRPEAVFSLFAVLLHVDYCSQFRFSISRWVVGLRTEVAKDGSAVGAMNPLLLGP
jgi:hypothetical protein